jgi:predicted metal-dependent TIM-barrel fold hydrolase
MEIGLQYCTNKERIVRRILHKLNELSGLPVVTHDSRENSLELTELCFLLYNTGSLRDGLSRTSKENRLELIELSNIHRVSSLIDNSRYKLILKIPAFYNISQPNFAILLILICSFREYTFWPR